MSIFSGPNGKKLMIQQGYVPETCVMDDQIAGPLIWSEVNAQRDPCAGCNHDRSKCGGRPPADSAQRQYHSQLRMEEFALSEKIRKMWNDSDPVAVGRARDEREARERKEQEERDRESEAISGPLHSPWDEIRDDPTFSDDRTYFERNKK